MSFERVEKDHLTDELIKQDIIHKFKEDSHIIITGVSSLAQTTVCLTETVQQDFTPLPSCAVA